jgi:hypothetical protein
MNLEGIDSANLSGPFFDGVGSSSAGSGASLYADAGDLVQGHDVQHPLDVVARPPQDHPFRAYRLSQAGDRSYPVGIEKGQLGEVEDHLTRPIHADGRELPEVFGRGHVEFAAQRKTVLGHTNVDGHITLPGRPLGSSLREIENVWARPKVARC